MRKNIKYSASFLIIILSLMLGFVAYAKDGADDENEKPVACTMDAKLCPDGVTSVGRVGPDCKFQACPGEKIGEDRNKFEELKREREMKREEIKKEKEGIKDELKNKKEQQKGEVEAMIQSIKTQREEFKKEFEIKKEEVKLKVEEMKTNLKEDLGKIKDEKKKLSTEKILEIIQDLNIKATDKLSERTDKIENVLVSIESRISKAEARGLDVALAKTEAEKAKLAIDSAREKISVQAAKVYEVNITTEATLRAEMKKLRDLFKADIKAVHEKVKLAHTAVKNTATALAKIDKIDDDSDESENEVENENKDTPKVEDNSGASSTTTN